MKKRPILLSSLFLVPTLSVPMLASSCNDPQADEKPSITNDKQLEEAQQKVAQYNAIANTAWEQYSKLDGQKSALLASLLQESNLVKNQESKVQLQQSEITTLNAHIQYYKLAQEAKDFATFNKTILELSNDAFNSAIKDLLESMKNIKFNIETNGQEQKLSYNLVEGKLNKAKSSLSGLEDKLSKNDVAIDNLKISLKAFQRDLETEKDDAKKGEIQEKIEKTQADIKNRLEVETPKLDKEIAKAKADIETIQNLLMQVQNALLKESLHGNAQAYNAKVAELKKKIADQEKVIAQSKNELKIQTDKYNSFKATIDQKIAAIVPDLETAYNQYTTTFDILKKLNTDIYNYDLEALDKTGIDPQQGQGTNLTKEELQAIINPDIEFSNYPVGDKIAQARVYQNAYNSTFALSAYPADFSASYGGRVSTSTIDSTTLSFISIETLGRPDINKEIKYEINSNGVHEKVKQGIISPELQRYKLELADAIYVYIPTTDASGTTTYETKVFDSDDAGIAPKGDNPDGTYSTTVIKRSSSNPRSINSDEFVQALNKAAKISFRIRPGQFWVTANGERTKYPVKAEDFYSSIVRTFMNDASFRRSHGGNSYIDAEARKLMTTPGKTFSADSTFPNAYIYNLFNIDIYGMLNKANSVQQVPNPQNPEIMDDLFVVNKVDSSPAQFIEFFNTIATGYDFVPAPSAYINQMTINNTEDIFAQEVGIRNDKKAYNEIVEAVKSASGLARETGIYWYGINPETTLFAGKYYGKPYDAETFSLSQYLNPYYFDTTYTGSKQTMLKMTTNYLQSPMDPESYKVSSYNKYLSGGLASYRFGELTQNNKSLVLKDPKAYGLSYVQVLSADSLTKSFIWSLIPKASNKPHFNEAFAYAMFGTSLKELTSGTAKGILPYTTVGLGGEFRNILSSAIAWASFADQLSIGNPSYPWITALAPDANIKSSDSDNSLPNNSLRPNHDIINGSFVIDAATGERVVFEATGETFLKPSDTKNLNVAAQDASKSVVYQQMQVRMKALLDQVYEQHPEISDQQVQIEIMWPYGNINQTQKLAYQNYAATINGLDPRIKFTIIDFPTENKNAFFDYWLSDTTPFLRMGWGYDYNGIGSGLTAYSQSLNLTALFANILVNQEFANKLKIGYPQIYKAAQAFNKFISAPGHKLSVSLEDIANNLTSAELQNIENWLGTSKYANGQIVPLEESEMNSDYIGYSDLNAKFWLEYNNDPSVTKKDLLDLAVEISNITGAVPDMFNLTASKSPFAQALTNPNYILPITFNGFIDNTNYRVAKPKK
ncbi:OppA family ABC transporter substrate-binding lipoprotein [Mycoplasma sp. Z331B]|uniref:OppA family ABC transporter substrate-binding lipoprotein n=1 Tax=Mycoplasma sp. Z331B TaxID=3398775 RepID=UPI003A838D8A